MWDVGGIPSGLGHFNVRWSLRRLGWWVDDHIDVIEVMWTLIVRVAVYYLLFKGYKGIMATHPELGEPIVFITTAVGLLIAQMYGRTPRR